MHRIKRNHANEHPRKLVFLDTETHTIPDQTSSNRTRQVFRLACSLQVRHYGTSYTPDEIRTWHDPSQFWEWLKSIGTARTVTWVFCHNLWFDMSIMGFREMLDHGRITNAASHRKCAYCRRKRGKRCHCWYGSLSLERGSSFAVVRCDGWRVNFVDSYNYVSLPLEHIGEEMGLSKLEFPGTGANDDILIEYCKRDVQILQKLVCDLICEWSVHCLGNWQMTGPSLAFSCYRHRFMDYPILHHGIGYVEKDEALCYIGGDTLVFFLGKIGITGSLYREPGETYMHDNMPHIAGPIYRIDCNSLYPYVMQEYDYPSRYVGTIPKLSIKEALELIKTNILVAHCSIDSDSKTYPIKLDGQVYHCTGKFWTVLTGLELHRALVSGHVKKFGMVHLYDKAPLFKNWVRFWYETKKYARENNMTTRSTFAKMMLNSISGKFAQKDKRWLVTDTSCRISRWDAWPEVDASSNTITNYRQLGRIVQRQVPAGYADHSLIAISACITANAREYMAGLREELPTRSVLYQDTDSLWLTDQAYQEMVNAGLIDPYELGKFRLEDTLDSGGIYGRKDYIANGKYTKAGIPKHAKWDGDRKWTCEVFEDGESMFARRPDASVIVRAVTIQGQEFQVGRMRGRDGWTLPLRIDDYDAVVAAAERKDRREQLMERAGE